MEEPTDFHDWELLLNSDTAIAAASSPAPGDASRDFGFEGDADGAIKYDYFALVSESRNARTTNSDEESLPDSDNPSWVDPNSDSRYLGQPKGQLGFSGIEFPCRDPGGFWTSDESSDGQKSPADHEKEGLGPGESSDSAACFGARNSVEIWSASGGNGRERVIEKAGLGGLGGTDVVKAERENSTDPLEIGESEALDESNTVDGNMENRSVAEGERTGMAWWKLPLELLKYCAFRVRPIWSVSVTAALVGIYMLGKRLYKMKRKTRRIPLKISIEDKRVSQFMARAARINEAFQVVKRVPIIRPGLPTTVSPAWPVFALR